MNGIFRWRLPKLFFFSHPLFFPKTLCLGYYLEFFFSLFSVCTFQLNPDELIYVYSSLFKPCLCVCAGQQSF